MNTPNVQQTVARIEKELVEHGLPSEDAKELAVSLLLNLLDAPARKQLIQDAKREKLRRQAVRSE